MPYVTAAVAAGSAALSYVGQQQVGKQAASMSKEQVALARQLLIEGSPLRAQLLSGTTAPADVDLAGHLVRGEVTQFREAWQQLRASGVDGATLARLQGHIDRGEMTKLRAAMTSLRPVPGQPGSAGSGGSSAAIFPEFFRTGEIPAILQPRPLAPLVNTYAPAREALESQYDVARDQVLGRSGGRGGALLSALTQVEMGRARDLGGLRADIARQQQARDDQQVLQENALRQSLFGQGIELAYGQVPTALNAYGTAASTFATLQGAAAGQNAASLRAAGSSTALALSLLKNQGPGGPTDLSTPDYVTPYRTQPMDITQGGYARDNY